jgi:hydroxymethylglutaryl-CoA synthase
VQPGAQEKVRALGLTELLAARRTLSIEEYERVMHAREAIDEKAHAPEGASEFGYLGVDRHRRTYARPVA